MVVFDTSVAAIAFDQNAAIPHDHSTNKPLTHSKKRIDALLLGLAQQKVRVILPTPVIAEYVVGGGPDKSKRLDIITSNKAFVVAPFDLRAAIECALIEDADSRRVLSTNETKAKIKFDRQIIAIALAQGADTIYTGDNSLGAKAKTCGLSVVYTWEIPLPPESAQNNLFNDDPQNDRPTA